MSKARLKAEAQAERDLESAIARGKARQQEQRQAIQDRHIARIKEEEAETKAFSTFASHEDTIRTHNAKGLSYTLAHNEIMTAAHHAM